LNIEIQAHHCFVCISKQQAAVTFNKDRLWYMSYGKQWLEERKALLEAIQRLTDTKEQCNWEPTLSYIEEQLKEEDVEKTRVIHQSLVELCQSPQKYPVALQLLDKLLPYSKLLRDWVLEPLDRCFIRLVESGSTQVDPFLVAWDECYGSQFPSLHAFVRRFVKLEEASRCEPPSCSSPLTTNPNTAITCTSNSTLDSRLDEEDILSVMEQLRECLDLIVPCVGNGGCAETGEEDAKEPSDITIQLVTDISLLENAENKIIFDSCRELLGQLEKLYSRLQQTSDIKKQVESLLQHCYRLGLRSQNNTQSGHGTSEQDDDDDILWETVDGQEEETNVEPQLETNENNNNNARMDQKDETFQTQVPACNDDILRQLETTVPYPKPAEKKSSRFKSTSTATNLHRRKKKEETSKQRIAKQLKQSASKVSKSWNQMQEREDSERYHQTFANSVTVGRID